MNRATFIAALASGVIGLPKLVAAETPEEKAIYDLLDAAIDAQFTSDFPRLVGMQHRANLRLFRDALAARFDQLLRCYSLKEITEVAGLPSHPKDLSWTDAEVFVAACNRAKDRHPEFVGNPKYLPLNIHGTIFDNENLAHILFSYSGAVRTERTDFGYETPCVCTVKREDGVWKVYSCFLVERVINDWWRDLAKPQAAPQKS